MGNTNGEPWVTAHTAYRGQHVIHVSSFKPIPLDRTVVQSLDEIAANDDGEEDDEDPLADELDPVNGDPLEPTVMDLVDHQDYEDTALDEGLIPLQPLPPVRGHRHDARPDSHDSTALLPDDGAVASPAGELPLAPAPVSVQVPIRRSHTTSSSPTNSH